MRCRGGTLTRPAPPCDETRRGDMDGPAWLAPNEETYEDTNDERDETILRECRGGRYVPH